MSLDYVARSKCGCITGWQSSDCNADVISEAVAAWIRDGRSVERMSTEDARAQFWCSHIKRQRTLEVQQ